MSLIQIDNLSFTYEGSYDAVFEKVSLRIDTDWKLGFIGRNGRGKTTFLRLLCGTYEYSGTISASVHFEYFPYEVTDTCQETKDVVADIVPGLADWELKRELSLLEVSEDVLPRPFGSLSNGEQPKVLLAALLLRENSFLLIDEPTNHLDMAARAVVSAYLNTKKGFILVSHDRAFLDQCVDHILSINKTGMEIQRGNFSSWQRNKERQDSFELSENERLKKDIRRLSASAKQAADWSRDLEKTKHGTRNSGLRPDRGYIGHKAAKMMKHAKSVEKRQQMAAEEKSVLLKDLESGESLKMSQLSVQTKLLVSLSNVSVFYGEKAVCRNVSLRIERGDRIALCGKTDRVSRAS
jgi:lincosamide and streptogramin A transport system ATP-binding/permease protein